MPIPEPTVEGLMELVSEYGQCRWSEGSYGATFLAKAHERAEREQAADLHQKIQAYAASLYLAMPAAPRCGSGSIEGGTACVRCGATEPRTGSCSGDGPLCSPGVASFVIALPESGNKRCNAHPDAPHGFNRNASHNAGRYVCDCEGWMPSSVQASFCIRCGRDREPGRCSADDGTRAAETCPYGVPGTSEGKQG